MTLKIDRARLYPEPQMTAIQTETTSLREAGPVSPNFVLQD